MLNRNKNVFSDPSFSVHGFLLAAVHVFRDILRTGLISESESDACQFHRYKGYYITLFLEN